MSFIKNYIKRYAANGLDVTDYVPIGLSKNTAVAMLTYGTNGAVNVTSRHFTLAYNPIVIGIVFRPEERSFPKSKVKLSFYNQNEKLLCELDLVFAKALKIAEISDCELSLFHIRDCSLHQLNWLRRSLILSVRYVLNRKSKKYFGTLPFSLHKQYAGVFTFPRKVVLVTVKDADYNKSFPIDLHGVMATDIFMLGLRHSNEAVPHLKNRGRLVISGVMYESYQHIYALGKFKSEHANTSSYQHFTTKHWGADIPDFVVEYLEIEILSHEDVGSQCLFFGRIIHKEFIREGPVLHHVHLIEYLEDYYSDPAPSVPL